MVRRRRRLGKPKAQHDTSARAEIVLPPISADAGAAEVGHQIVQLGHAPSDILPKYEIHTTTRRDRKGVLRVAILGDAAARVRKTHQELGERDEVIKFAKIEARTKKAGAESAARAGGRGRRGDRREVAIKLVNATLRNQAEPAIRIVNKFATAAL